MKLCVIGTGYVGLVSAACFAEMGHDVTGVDIDGRKIERLNSGECLIHEPGLPELLAKHLTAGTLSFTTNLDEGIRVSPLIMACVGTPIGQGRRADLSQVENVCRMIGQHCNGEKIFVMKSTVPVGTSEKCRAWVEEEIGKRGVRHPVHLVSNPEFLREGKAVQDFMQPDRIVVGCKDRKAGLPAEDRRSGSKAAKAGDAMRALYRPLIENGVPCLEMSVESAELCKYASNAFLATKISFINFVAALCERAGANIDDVARGMGLDHRIGSEFLNAGIGYGGSCFPKDVQALIKTADALGVPSQLLRDVEAINEAQRDAFVRNVEEGLGGVRGKTLAVWGLAFKPDTDDMRSAPSIDIIAALADKGANVTAYDPVAMAAAKKMLPDTVMFAKTAEGALAGADALLLLTEWGEFGKWKPDDIAKRLKGKRVFDGRNVFDASAMRDAGLAYTSIGRT